MDLRLNFSGCVRFLGGRDQLGADKKPTGRTFCTFSFEGGMLEIMINSNDLRGIVEGNLYNIAGMLEPVNYNVNFNGQTYARQAFRVLRVTELKPVQSK